MTTDERDILNSVKIPPPVSKAFPELYWVDHKPALLSADGTLLGWNEVTLDKLRDVLETHSPVCWDCYIAQMFCRDHPDLVVIRPGQNGRPFIPTEETMPLTTWMPLCDIYETDKELVLKLELPDMKKEDVYVTVDNNLLTLRGERKFDEKIERENFHRIERHYGEFLRTFTLPTFVEGDKIFAEFKDGLLTVTLPKNTAAIPKQIEVKVK